MAPSELRSQTLKALRALRKDMASADWLLAMEAAAPATKTRAAKLSLRVNHAIRKLENEQLAAIRNALKANEQQLKNGIDDVDRATKRIKQTKGVLDAVDGFLGVIKQVVTLL